jgi:hypothetical protein
MNAFEAIDARVRLSDTFKKSQEVEVSFHEIGSNPCPPSTAEVNCRRLQLFNERGKRNT